MAKVLIVDDEKSFEQAYQKAKDSLLGLKAKACLSAITTK